MFLNEFLDKFIKKLIERSSEVVSTKFLEKYINECLPKSLRVVMPESMEECLHYYGLFPGEISAHIPALIFISILKDFLCNNLCENFLKINSKES